VRKATIFSRPVKNWSRLRQAESTLYAPATRSGSRVFHASSAAWTFLAAVSAVKGGNGGRSSGMDGSLFAGRLLRRLAQLPAVTGGLQLGRHRGPGGGVDVREERLAGAHPDRAVD